MGKASGETPGTAPQAIGGAEADLVELHVCMGLNACKGHGVNGSGEMAGMGECATSYHECHGANACRGQGGCGFLGSEAEQAKPGDQSCVYNGSCATPINVSRVSSAGSNKGKNVWKLARARFETRMYEAGVPFGPSPGEGVPDDEVPSYARARFHPAAPAPRRSKRARPKPAP
ncbi:MAG: hypothetical protein ACT4PW_09755 [Acidimicrobiia bacterium]